MNRTYLASAKDGFSGHGLQFPCALGKGGLVLAKEKREGDGASPIGTWPVRRIFYRPDRITNASIGWIALKESDGWCDTPGDANYNQLVSLPYPASHEKLWRDEAVYDLVVELGYNDDPTIDGHGSAIFMHIARPDYAPTEGCVALARENLLQLLTQLDTGDIVEIAL